MLQCIHSIYCACFVWVVYRSLFLSTTMLCLHWHCYRVHSCIRRIVTSHCLRYVAYNTWMEIFYVSLVTSCSFSLCYIHSLFMPIARDEWKFSKHSFTFCRASWMHLTLFIVIFFHLRKDENGNYDSERCALSHTFWYGPGENIHTMSITMTHVINVSIWNRNMKLLSFN